MVSTVDMVDTAVISLGCDPGSDHVTTPMPLPMQLAEQIREQIRTGQLRPGDRLPSTARLVEQGWARSTVVAGVRILRETGWVRGQPGQATFVANDPPIGQTKKADRDG
jgi:DNA-binding GntR family transcriptional regulator